MNCFMLDIPENLTRMVLENPKAYFNRVSSTIALHFSFTNHDMELSYCFLIFSLGVTLTCAVAHGSPIISCDICMACFRYSFAGYVLVLMSSNNKLYA